MILIFLRNLQNQRNQSKKRKKKALTLRITIIFLNKRQKVLNVFQSGILPRGKQRKALPSILDCVAKISDQKVSDCKFLNHKQLKITPKQMLQRLPTVLAQVKAGNTSENFLNEI